MPPPAPLPNEVFTYGTQHTLTATAQLGSDTIEILVNNKVVASGTGTASYTICSTMTMQTCLANATYSVEAYEVQTNEYSSPSVLTIQKAAPQLSLNSPSNFQYTGSGGTINYGIGTLGNQALATLYVNGGNAGSTYTSASYTTSATAGTYNIYLQTNGNQNYTAASRSASFTIAASGSYIYAGDWTNLEQAAFRTQGCCNWWTYGWDYGGSSPFRTLYTYKSNGQYYDVLIIEGMPTSYIQETVTVPQSYMQNLVYGDEIASVWTSCCGYQPLYLDSALVSEVNKYNTSFASYPGYPNGEFEYMRPFSYSYQVYVNGTCALYFWLVGCVWLNPGYWSTISGTGMGAFFGTYTLLGVNSNTGIATVSLTGTTLNGASGFFLSTNDTISLTGGTQSYYQNTIEKIPAWDLQGGVVTLSNGQQIELSRVDAQIQAAAMPGNNGPGVIAVNYSQPQLGYLTYITVYPNLWSSYNYTVGTYSISTGSNMTEYCNYGDDYFSPPVPQGSAAYGVNMPAYCSFIFPNGRYINTTSIYVNFQSSPWFGSG